MNDVKKLISEEVRRVLKEEKKKRILENKVRELVRKKLLTEEVRKFDGATDEYKKLRNKLNVETAKKISDRVSDSLGTHLEIHRGGKRVYILTKGLPYYEVEMKIEKERVGTGTTNMNYKLYTDTFELNNEEFQNISKAVKAIEEDRETIENTVDTHKSWKSVKQDYDHGEYEKGRKFQRRYKDKLRTRSVDMSNIEQERPAPFAGHWDEIIPGDVTSFRSDSPSDQGEFDLGTHLN